MVWTVEAVAGTQKQKKGAGGQAGFGPGPEVIREEGCGLVVRWPAGRAGGQVKTRHGLGGFAPRCSDERHARRSCCL